MKKKVIFILVALLPIAAWGQTMDAISQINADSRKAYGNDYPYLFDQPALTPSPKGYKPFYISHYGRHGSRYYWSNNLYRDIDSLLTKAHRLQLLTPEGEAFRDRFEETMPELKARWGELSELGWKQHQGIANTMYHRFRKLFTKGAHVTAISSLSGRCVMSMSAFCLELQQQCPSLEIREESSRTTLDGVVPYDSQNPHQHHCATLRPRYESNMASFHRDTAYATRVVGRLLTSTDGLDRSDAQIAADLKNLYTSLPSIGHEGMMEGIYSDDDVVSQWELSNLDSYSWVFESQLEAIPILEDILDKAQKAIDGTNGSVADLRFGHDSCLGPLTVLMGINGADLDPADPYEVKNCYQNFETCKASNIQLIFYRNRKDDILVKCLLNGLEASLPIPSDIRPYYHWQDVSKYYEQHINQDYPRD